ncbi:hypothetical protein QZH41_017586, partial [Actinostola sp. cb2023]
SSSMILEGFAVVFVASIAIVIYTLTVHFTKDRRLPPGPVPLPLVGNMFNMGPQPHLSLTSLAKKYGDIFRLTVGIRRIVVVNSIEAAREALVHRSNDFAGRPLLYTASLITRKGKSISFGDFDSTWKKQRKIAHSALRMFGNGIERLEGKVCLEVHELIKRLVVNGEAPFNPAHDIQLATVNIICSFVFGSRYDMNDPEFHRVVMYTDQFAQAFRAGLSIVKKAIQERDVILERKYREHCETYQDHVTRDLTDALIQATKETQEEQKSTSPDPLTEDNVIMTMSDIFSAGIETMSTCLLWTIIYMVRNPEVQHLVHEELDKVIGQDRVPAMNDRQSLPYMEATVAEVLRFSSPVPLLFPHSTTVDTNLNGYFIPKDTVVLFNTWAIHHDTEKWSHPEKFDPTRFLDSEGNLISPATLSYLPFSAGRRVCLAETLAKIQLFLFISQLLHKFEFKIPENSPAPEIEGIFGASLVPKPFKIIANSRF